MTDYFLPTVLTAKGWQENCRVSVNHTGMIERIATRQDPQSDDISLEGVTIPGMPNLHSHAFQYALAGLTYARGAAQDSFWSWRETMYQFVQRLEPQHLQAIAEYAYMQMLQQGYTTVAEFHYLHHQADGSRFAGLAENSQRIFQAAQNTGVGLTLLPVLYCQSGFGAAGVNDRQRPFFNTVEQYLRLYEACQSWVDGVTPYTTGCAPHSLRAVNQTQLEELLQVIQPAAQQPLHMHIAEQPLEVEESLAYYQARPVSWLLEHFPVNQYWCLIHATHLDQQELQSMAQVDAVAGLCPTTEADLGDGFFALDEWLRQSGAIGIGSDSNLRVSACEELRLLDFGQRLQLGRRNHNASESQTVGRRLYELAGAGGARALGQPVGAIQVGTRADWVVLDDQHPQLYAKQGDPLLDSYIFAHDQKMIKQVFVAGQQLVYDGLHQQHIEIAERFRRSMAALMA